MNITCFVWLCLCQGDPPTASTAGKSCWFSQLPNCLQSSSPGFGDVCVLTDIRELIEVDDVMEDESLRFGPNGGLVFCMEYFANNFSWLEESLGHVEDDYVLFDCPGKYTPMFRFCSS